MKTGYGIQRHEEKNKLLLSPPSSFIRARLTQNVQAKINEVKYFYEILFSYDLEVFNINDMLCF